MNGQMKSEQDESLLLCVKSECVPQQGVTFCTEMTALQHSCLHSQGLHHLWYIGFGNARVLPMALVSVLSGGFFVQTLNFQITFKDKVRKYKATFKRKKQLLFSTALKCSHCGSITLQLNVRFVLQNISLSECELEFACCNILSYFYSNLWKLIEFHWKTMNPLWIWGTLQSWIWLNLDKMV